ncbi:MAG: transcriptional regulator, AraC family [Paenibacillus sp.]|nr:transcriptional regulator, AraC family [Paenibacillus sp.]
MSVLKPLMTKEYDHQEDHFRVNYVQRNGRSDSCDFHFHGNYELYYLLAGQRKYFIRDRIHLVQKGDMVFIPKHDLHRTRDAGPYHERMLIYFDDAFLETIAGPGGQISPHLLQPFRNSNPVFRLQKEERRFVDVLFYRILKEVEEKPVDYQLYLKALFIELLVYVSRCTEKYVEVEVHSPLDTPIQKKISEIANYIQENYEKSLTLAYLSKHFYISTYYLSRVFKEVSGFSFVEYLNNVRIIESQRLLRETDLPIFQISEQVGFVNTTNFGRVFKQVVHLSPLQYRRMQQATK